MILKGWKVNFALATVVKGTVNLMTHSGCLNVVVEPVLRYSEHFAMARSYAVLKLGRSKIDSCLRNHSVKQITLPKWTDVGEIAAAMRQVRVKPLEKGKSESQKQLLDKPDLTGLGQWSQNEKRAPDAHNRVCW